MKLCRFDLDRLGVIDGDDVIDVLAVLDALPATRWAREPGDPVVARLDALCEAIGGIVEGAPRRARGEVRLAAPVATPTKIIGAPVNYHAHLAEARADRDLHQGRTVHPIDEIGCFLKANSALAGHGDTVALPVDGTRVDPEAEVAVIIGAPARNVRAVDAHRHVAGYALALDISVRGKQDRSMRKSCDGFAVLGPWLVTPDELPDVDAIPFALEVGGERRQAADTSMLIRSVGELVEMCSAFYTLWPGDVIMTGTPAGVAPVVAGDVATVSSPVLGSLSVTFR